MAFKKDVEGIDMLAKSEETQAMMKQALGDESFIVDGTAIIERILSGEDKDSFIKRVIKLEPRDEKELNPAVIGVFQGYEPVLVRAPDASPDTPKQLMNFALFEVRPGFVAQLLCSAQMEQGLRSVKIGQTAAVVQPWRKAAPGEESVRLKFGLVPVYNDIGGGRRVRVTHVMPKGGRGVGSATPFGEMGKRLVEMKMAALPSGANVVDGEMVTPSGEVIENK